MLSVCVVVVCGDGEGCGWRRWRCEGMRSDGGNPKRYYSSKRYDGACATAHTYTFSGGGGPPASTRPAGERSERSNRSRCKGATIRARHRMYTPPTPPPPPTSTADDNGHPIVLFRTMPPRTVAPTTVLPFYFFIVPFLVLSL
ncbi:unnamed protein product [Macrosiphum euphorbiae]|uniref:Uncharacterized protein n=1 Tax=Macrosiphum euphorbiae TaxID=13131 RepID=A0AAV0WV06_9HEMI|nr:unnamed protein product [Macrosiphum euphorbiae]